MVPTLLQKTTEAVKWVSGKKNTGHCFGRADFGAILLTCKDCGFVRVAALKQRMARVEEKLDTVVRDIAQLTSQVEKLAEAIGSLTKDVAYVRGHLESMPTTIQLLGFIVAIFVAAGLTRVLPQ